MADRKERVILDLDPQPYVRGLGTASAATAGFLKQLDDGNDRATLIVQSILALAPAAVSMGATAVPVLTALTAQLGFAAAGMGVLVAGTVGVGDALEALNDYQLEPTEENLTKLQEELRGLGPAAREFVVFLDEITPKLQRLRREAQDEWLPGATEAIDTLIDSRLPEARRVIEQLARTSGDLAVDTADALASDQWEDFFDYLQTDAAPNLDAFGRTLGNVITAAANTLVAFDPASDMAAQGLLDWSRGLAEASADLDTNQGFQDFLSYVRDNGPQAVETLSALGGAVVDLLEAAAPVGAATLPLLEALATVLSAIAESPAGPLLIAAAAGVSTLSRAVGLYNAANGSAMLTMLRGTAATGPAAAAGATAAASGLGRLNASIAGLQTAAKVGVPALGAVALTATDVDEKAGLANTAMYALLGTMIAPGWGTAIGATVGLMMDWTSANDDAAASLDRVNQAIDTSDYDGLLTQLRFLRDDIDATEEKRSKLAGAVKLIPVIGAYVAPKLQGDNDEEIDRLNAQAAAAERASEGYERLALALGAEGFQVSLPILGTQFVGSLEQVDDLISRAAPALEEFGISAQEIAAMDSTELDILADRIRSFNREAESTPARTGAVRDAIRGLDDDLMTTADSAAALQDALDELLGPELGVSEARDQWTRSLRTLNDELAKSKELVGDTNAALTNREAIRTRVSQIQTLLVAEAEAGASSKDLARILRDQRRALLDAGEAAGLSRKDLRDYLEQLNLTPKIIRTIIEAKTEKAQSDVQALLDKMAQVRNKRATVTVTTVFTGDDGRYFKDFGPTGSAYGSTVPDDGRPYGDRFPYLLAPREEVVSNAEGQADTYRPTLKAINSGASPDVVAATLPRIFDPVPATSGRTTAAPALNLRALGDEIARLRPLHGDVYVSDGYGGFKDEMLADAQAAANGKM